MFVSVGISFKRAGTVPDGNALNAASVGANNVNGPGPDSVPDKNIVKIKFFIIVFIRIVNL
jgi:predicted SAM-dependent methyltransferase